MAISESDVQPNSPPDPAAVARLLFDQGFNCAEAVLMALAGDDDGGALPWQRAAATLGGGIARQGLVCGCLTGCAMAVGVRIGRLRPDDSAARDRSYSVTAAIYRRFRQRFGALDCRLLTGLDFSRKHSPEVMRRLHAETCAPMVEATVRIALEELSREE
jgi:C_GCAxxG_C_C family probable redox protein